MKTYAELLTHTVEALNLHQTDVLQLDDDALRELVRQGLREQLREGRDWQIEESEQQLTQRVLDDVVGLGPLEGLLRDESVSEIMVNRYNQIFIEQSGRLQLSNVQFMHETALRQVLERIVAPLGRRIDASSPMVDARLANGSRVNAVLPPLAVAGACLTIRKFSNQRIFMANLVDFGSISPLLADLLEIGVKHRQKPSD